MPGSVETSIALRNEVHGRQCTALLGHSRHCIDFTVAIVDASRYLPTRYILPTRENRSFPVPPPRVHSTADGNEILCFDPSCKDGVPLQCPDFPIPESRQPQGAIVTQINFMGHTGTLTCVRCDFTTQPGEWGAMGTELQTHLDQEHPGWQNYGIVPTPVAVPKHSERPVCMFCLEPATHKCGQDHACDECCAHMGELAGTPAYDWVRRIIAAHRAKAATISR